jgi:hypothetical protein
MRAPAAGVVALAALLLGSPEDQAVVPLASPPPPDTVAVTLTLTLQLTSLHPAASQGWLTCGAKGGPKNSLDEDASTITSKAAGLDTSGNMGFDTFNQRLMYQSHYNGSQVGVAFAIANRAYSGTHAITLYVPYRSLIDPATKAVWSAPAVLAGCWLSINNKPAQRGVVGEVATADNVAHVSGSFFLVSTLTVSSQAPN